MKSLLLLCVFSTSLFVSSASLIDALNAIHKSPEFNKLSHHDQILVIELIAETEAGELKAYVDRVGFHNVLAVIDKLPAAEAHILTNYLQSELAREEHQGTTAPSAVVGKRSLVEVLNAAKGNPAFQHLSATDQDLIIKMLTAAENSTLTQLVDQLGYSEVLRVADIMPVAERHLFQHYLIQHLQSETSALG